MLIRSSWFESFQVDKRMFYDARKECLSTAYIVIDSALECDRIEKTACIRPKNSPFPAIATKRPCFVCS
jgi:hypothetical protein